MMEKPRTDQEQWTADMLRMLGFDVKMNFWRQVKGTRFEIDVLGRLGPIQLAVECKKLSSGVVSLSDVEYFHKKLKMLRNALGVFVANEFSKQGMDLCSNLGILPLTSDRILEEIERLREKGLHKRDIRITNSTYEVLAGLMRFAMDWECYFDPDWPFHKEIYSTDAFESCGLIKTYHRGLDSFQYKHREAGKDFFSRMRNIHNLLKDVGVQAIQSLSDAAVIIVTACKTNTEFPIIEGYDRLIINGVGLQNIVGESTDFARMLASVIESSVLSEKPIIRSKEP